MRPLQNRMLLLSFIFVSMAGCSADERKASSQDTNEQSELSEDPLGRACHERHAQRDGSLPECPATEPTSETEPSSEGYVFSWLSAQEEPIQHVALVADTAQSVRLLAGGSGADGLGCPDRFSATLTADPEQPSKFSLEVRHGFNTEKSCAGGFSSGDATVDFPPLAPGEYRVRFAAAVHPDCKTFPCEQEVTLFNYQVIEAELPVSVRP